ncbi:aldo/keto reductase [candidate division KSB1 bacterium]|nr:MAG: aldo/keto reductase [candidate division KSB1 bacterium]
MYYRTFGKLGWKISEISFGAWAIGGDMWGPQDDADSIRALHRAIDLGVNFIDTAQGYGKGHSEELIGKVLKERSEEIYVATKVPAKPGSKWPLPENANANEFFPASYIIEQCEGSLRRLQRDHLDIYQFHTWATAFNVQDEWFEAMAKLKQQGKIHAIGVSVPDTTPDNVIGALALDRVQSVQVIYNIFEQYPQWNLLPVCEKLGIGVIVRVPFDEGALTGKYTTQTTFPEGDVRRRYFRGRNLPAVINRVEKIREFKNKRHPHMSMAEYALRFCLSHSAVNTVIPGIRNVQQAEMNLAASDGLWLDSNELQELKQFAWMKDFWHEEVT